tara:strand:+ start:758 stop:895 length:138 start_codon:yes stop_codon:yes gene_type:complete
MAAAFLVAACLLLGAVVKIDGRCVSLQNYSLRLVFATPIGSNYSV